ncbi:MAG TPA: LysE family translocator [Terriglobia bacterium]|nr:LysE family translocator [Terriglobia bacterium]
MSFQLYLAFVAACFVAAIIPGPTTTLIVANSLRHGMRAGLLNAAGTQLGCGTMLALVLLGLATVIANMGHWFDWLRLAGAAYLIYLGWKLIRATGATSVDQPMQQPRGGFFIQGCLVSLSNPKQLLFFGAFLPQFIDPQGNYTAQIALLGVTALVCGGLSDSSVALLSGRAARMLSPARSRWIMRCSGGALIGGGLWLGLSRAR